MKICTKCEIAKDFTQFTRDKTKKDGFYSSCRQCVKMNRKIYYCENKIKCKAKALKWEKENPNRLKYLRKQMRKGTKYKERNREYQAYRNALKISSALLGFRDQIRKIYDNCPPGYHVDHIVPLRGKNVCGLHVPWNLQYLTAEENRRKNNKFQS